MICGIFWLWGGFFLHLTCCKQFLGNQGVFCYVVDYTIDFSEPNIYCRVSSSCDTIAEMKKWKWAHLVLFSCVCCLLLYTEYFISVFYSCLFCFFIPVFKHSGLSLKEEDMASVKGAQINKQEAFWSQVSPGLFFIWVAYYSTTSNITVISATWNRSWNTVRAASVLAQWQLLQ